MKVQVEMTPELATTIHEVAELEGLSVAELLVETAAFVSSERQRSRAVLRERIAKADRGEFLSDEEASARLAKILYR